MKSEYTNRKPYRTKWVSIDHMSLPLLESRHQRQQRALAYQRKLHFVGGVCCAFASIAVLAIVF